MIPSKANGDSVDDKWMYCVSLVFRKSSMARPQINERDIDEQCVRELQHNELVREVDGSKFQSPLFTTCSHDGRSRTRSMKVSQALKQFNSKLQEQKWSQQASQGVIGIALISRRNVTHAMRETLSLLYGDFCSVKGDGHEDEISRNHVCQPLVDILGVFTHSQGVEASSLSCLLQPYHAYTTSRWVHRPLSDQTDIFSKSSGMQLLQTLPPVPLALAFITILLEQKVSGNYQDTLSIQHHSTSLNIIVSSLRRWLVGSVCVVQKRDAHSSVFWNVAALATINVGTFASPTRSSFHDERTHSLSSSIHARIPHRRKR